MEKVAFSVQNPQYDRLSLARSKHRPKVTIDCLYYNVTHDLSVDGKMYDLK